MPGWQQNVLACSSSTALTALLSLAMCKMCLLTSPHQALPLPLFPIAASTQGADVSALTLRGFTYQAVGQLAQRQPGAFAGRMDIAAR